jgi:hypothetical protein
MLEKLKEGSVDTTKHGMTYLEMKYNLLLSYISFLSIVILLKLEGKPLRDHPVIHRLLHIKLLLERLRPLDSKLQYQIDKSLRTAALNEVGQPTTSAPVVDSLQYRPNIENLQMSSSEDQSERSGGAASDSDSEHSDSDESRKGKPKKDVFKAAKLNPVLYEDKDTKK